MPSEVLMALIRLLEAAVALVQWHSTSNPSFLYILQLFTTTTDADVKTATKLLLSKVFSATGLFNGIEVFCKTYSTCCSLKNISNFCVVSSWRPIFGCCIYGAIPLC
jgi:hypothetical protein